MKRSKQVALVLCGAAAMLLGLFAPTARAADKTTDPPTTLGYGTRDGIVAGAGAVDNQVFWSVQDLHSKAKLLLSFNTTPAIGIPTPIMLAIAFLPNGRQVVSEAPARFTIQHDPPSITSAVGSVTWVPARQAYHLTLSMALLTADLWITGPTGAASLPTYWDGYTSFLNESVGAGTANGTITFPGSLPSAVRDWGAEQDTEYGTYDDGISPLQAPNHIGYEYAASDNPDGSADFLLAFVEMSSTPGHPVWRGMLSHTSVDGKVTECEPSGPGEVTLSNWTTATTQLPPNLTGFPYPQTVSAHCGALSKAWTTTPADTQVVPVAWYSMTVADSAVHSNVAGSVGIMQHFRESGSYTKTP
jgi:hypothetical protein